MANKIDKINVGGADYEINLPTTATPSITSLTVTGNLTCSGTANLSVVNFNSVSEGFIYAKNLTLSAVSDVDINAGRYFQVRTLQGNQTFMSPVVRFSSPLFDANGRNILINPGINKNNEIVSSITFLDSDTNNTIEVYKDRFLFNGAPITVSSIGNSLSNLCQLPSKSGTIALLDDVQEAKSELYLFDFDITFAGGQWRGQCTGQFLHNSLDLYTEGLNSINSSTSFDIFVSHLIKSDSQIVTGKMIKNDASTYAFITSIAYDNEKGFGFIGYEGVTNISPIAIYKNQDNINTAACRCFVTKILG